MSTYPGEDPKTPDSQPPLDDAAAGTPVEDTTEPTQPVGYWERQAAEQEAERAPQQPPATTPYPQDTPSASAPQNPYPLGPPNPYGPYSQQPYGAQQPGTPPPPGQHTYYRPTQPAGVPYQQPYAAYSPAVPDHPQSTLAMVLGIVGLVGAFIFCGLPLVVSPFAWALGHNALKEIKASQGRLGGASQARAGTILGIIGTVLAILAIVAIILFIIVVAASDSTTSGSSI